MTKLDAIQKIFKVQNGEFKREIPKEILDQWEAECWTDPKFSFGMEYGYIQGLMEAFDLTFDDIKEVHDRMKELGK